MGHLGDHRAAQIVQNVAIVHVLLVEQVGVALLRRLLALLALGGRGRGRREGGNLDDKVALAGGGGAAGGGISGDFVDRTAGPAAQLAADSPGLGRWADEDAGGAAAAGAFRLGHRCNLWRARREIKRKNGQEPSLSFLRGKCQTDTFIPRVHDRLRKPFFEKAMEQKMAVAYSRVKITSKLTVL